MKTRMGANANSFFGCLIRKLKFQLNNKSYGSSIAALLVPIMLADVFLAAIHVY
jgi:hypothetical protein